MVSNYDNKSHWHKIQKVSSLKLMMNHTFSLPIKYNTSYKLWYCQKINIMNNIVFWDNSFLRAIYGFA